MHKKTKSWPKGFGIYYLLAAVLVALTSALAVLASVLPAKVAVLTQGIDIQIAVFMVPMVALMFGIIAEVLRATLKGLGHSEHAQPARRIAHWNAGHR